MTRHAHAVTRHSRTVGNHGTRSHPVVLPNRAALLKQLARAALEGRLPSPSPSPKPDGFEPPAEPGPVARPTPGALEVIAGNDVVRRIDGDQSVALSGNGARLVITGHCPELMVTGNHNEVRIEGTVGRIIVAGNDNRLCWRAGQAPPPDVLETGNRNLLGPA